MLSEPITARCTNCKRTFEHEKVTATYHTLDGLPPTNESQIEYCRTKEDPFLNSVAICPHCHAVTRYREVKENNFDSWFAIPQSIEYSEIIQSLSYQSIARNPAISVLERKLRLMEYFPALFGDIDVLWAHYLDQHHPDQAQTHLLNAIEDIENRRLFIQRTGTALLQSPNGTIIRPFVMTESILLIDFYRRTQQFSKAQELIEKMWFGKHTNADIFFYEWLETQEELIVNKDSRHTTYYP
ncbi:MAG: hypothetical protein IJZ68_07850 [Bacteroidaceae bacterium]|nr:hypothetical protein [Bacteroidaceae bacterium]